MKGSCISKHTGEYGNADEDECGNDTIKGYLLTKVILYQVFAMRHKFIGS